MLLPWLLILFSHLVLPAAYCYGIARPRTSQSTWCVRALGAAAYIAFVFIAGRWDWLSYELRFLWPALLLATLLIGARRLRGRVWFDLRERWKLLGDLAASATFALLCAFTVAGLIYRGEVVDLAVPLRTQQRLYVAQGGDSVLLNHHRPIPEQQFALDLTVLNAWGSRGSLLPAADLNAYAAFGVEVVSPCAGEVVAAVEGRPDHVPPARDPDKPAGNHVLLRCLGVHVLVAHLRNGSLQVRPGDRVDVGSTLGRVGNSGNTTEPHLHVEATRDGIGVAMRVGGRVLARNSVLPGAADGG